FGPTRPDIRGGRYFRFGRVAHENLFTRNRSATQNTGDRIRKITVISISGAIEYSRNLRQYSALRASPLNGKRRFLPFRTVTSQPGLLLTTRSRGIYPRPI